MREVAGFYRTASPDGRTLIVLTASLPDEKRATMRDVFLYRFAAELWFEAPGLFPRYVLDVQGRLIFADDPEFASCLLEYGISSPLEQFPVYVTYKVAKVRQAKEGAVSYTVTRNDSGHTSLKTNSKANVCLNVINHVRKIDGGSEWESVRLVSVEVVSKKRKIEKVEK